MSSTYLELCIKLRREAGIVGSDPTTVVGQTNMLAKIVGWIADADEDIQSKWLDWGFLHDEFSSSTVAGDKDIAAPADFGMWDEDSFYLDYSLSSFQKLSQVDYSVWRKAMRNGVKTNAKPAYYVIKPDKDIILEPVPDDVYTLTADYYKTATRLAADSDTSLIPKKFDRLIIARAKMYYAEFDNAPEVMNAATQEYIDLMNRLESLYLPGQQPNTQSSNNMVIVPE